LVEARRLNDVSNRMCSNDGLQHRCFPWRYLPLSSTECPSTVQVDLVATRRNVPLLFSRMPANCWACPWAILSKPPIVLPKEVLALVQHLPART
jgi:hypothetical protein